MVYENIFPIHINCNIILEQDATKRKGNKQTALNFLVKNTATN